MTDDAEPEQTEAAEQTEEPQQSDQAEPTLEGKKPKMCKLAVLSIVCIVAAFAILAVYLFSSEASIPLRLENLLMPAGVAILAVALVAGVIALVMIKASGDALAGRRLALLGIIVPIVVAVAFVRSSSGPTEEPLVLPSTQCRSNISQLAVLISEYRRDNDGRFPKAEKWCDILLEQTKAEESLFACPLAEGARCSYSLNKYAAQAGSDLPDDMVLLFESKPGWNQVGGPELFVAPHESRRGNSGSVLFGNGKARFVSEDGLEELNWKP
jgi:hypothetical protein